MAIVAVAVALGEDELVVDDNADANSGRVPVFQQLLHVGIEAFELFGDIELLRANREGTQQERRHYSERPNRGCRAEKAKPAVEAHGTDSFPALPKFRPRILSSLFGMTRLGPGVARPRVFSLPPCGRKAGRIRDQEGPCCNK